MQSVGKVQKLFGTTLPAFDSYLLVKWDKRHHDALSLTPLLYLCVTTTHKVRGLKSFDVRMERHASNAMHVAQWLENHPKVAAVHYPGMLPPPIAQQSSPRWWCLRRPRCTAGLASHPQHDLAKRTVGLAMSSIPPRRPSLTHMVPHLLLLTTQLRQGFGGMLAFELKGGAPAGIAMLENLKLINLAVSLGTVSSTMRASRRCW